MVKCEYFKCDAEATTTTEMKLTDTLTVTAEHCGYHAFQYSPVCTRISCKNNHNEALRVLIAWKQGSSEMYFCSPECAKIYLSANL